MAGKKYDREKANAVAEGNWVPSPEAKSKSLWFRIGAIVLWAVAIGLEIFVIVKYLLPSKPVNTWLIIGLIVAIGVAALAGSFLWKKANHISPASEKNKVAFWVQNQLGVIITVIAFLPLIVLIFLDKDMDGKQKGILGGVAIAVAVAVGLLSADYHPVSQEQITRERNVVQELTGQNEVWWSKSGEKFHVCKNVGALRNTKPENLRSGTVEKAHEDGINELTKQWVSEARSPKQCNIPNADAKIEAILNGAVPGLSADEAKKTVDEGEAAEVTQAPASVPATNAPATSPAKKAPTHTRTPVPVG
ncbi:hypothetical protein GCM10010528_14030 [Gordonia defluvii]|jgi:uncharacterized protein with PQ loop repeat|uniref:Uncharacterized protein n=1 Tax=Gordonia defluvii TaxID=283718 RepID=A0ABP6LB50_9ACTN|nr:hypothetical protein [Gordonia sp. UBA5067]